MTAAVAITPDLSQVVREALKAFRTDSSYTAEMIQAARALEARKGKR